MLAALALIAALAAGPATATPEPAKPPAAASEKPAKPEQVCTTRKVGKVLGHEVTHVKCDDAKPAPAPPAPALAAPR